MDHNKYGAISELTVSTLMAYHAWLHRELWVPCPWRFPRSVWMETWAALPDGGAHSPWQGDRNRMGFKVPPNLSHLMIHSLAEKADLDLFIHDPCHYTQVSAFGVIQGCWIKVSLDAGLPVGYQGSKKVEAVLWQPEAAAICRHKSSGPAEQQNPY